MRIKSVQRAQSGCMDAQQIVGMTSAPMDPSALKVLVCPSCRAEFAVLVYRAALVDRQQCCPDCDYTWW